MFFKAIAPACLKGIKFSISIESADNGLMSVGITPTSETGKSGFCLTPRQFVASPEEFDTEFAAVMGGFATTQMTLSDQLKAAELAAQDVAKAAMDEVHAKKQIASKPAANTGYKAKAIKGKTAPAGLLDDDVALSSDNGSDDDNASDDGNDDDDGADVSSPVAQAPRRDSVTPAAAVQATESLNFDL